MVSFDSFHRKLSNQRGGHLEEVFAELPVTWQQAAWSRLAEQIEDARMTDGRLKFRSRKVHRPKASTVSVSARKHRSTSHSYGPDRLVEIDAAVYLEAFGSEVFAGGRARCPHRDHADNNPSASYRGGEWFCFTCAEGGGIYQAASAASGIGTKGSEFIELRRWIADRLVGMVGMVAA